MLHPFQPCDIDAVLDQIARGNRDAFRQVVRAYSLPLRSYIAGQVHYMNDVDDLVQEVFIAAYRNLGTFRRGEDLGGWLRGIARHKLHSHWRRSARGNRALERFREELARVVESDLDRAASAHSGAIEMLLHCIAQLPEKLRRVVRGGLEGDKPAALAEELVTTVGAIYNLHYRANQLLRECVRKEMG
jgi:RNA polymerase sigma-70 factor, ECF subfamily